MRVGQTYELRIRSADVTHGLGGLQALGVGDLVLTPGSAAIVRTVQPMAAQTGNHPFECTVFCGSGHPFFGRIEVAP
jgi:heme/copper-type cytochrome/quinol oxidase subunit 2